MAMKYRERISEFITTINTDKSYKMNDELLDVLKNNPNNIKRVIDNSSMRSTFKTEKERILANLANNSIYDSWPLPNPNKSFELRPRAPEKEIGETVIRYKPKYIVERVKDTVDKNSVLFTFEGSRSKSSLSPINRSQASSAQKGEYLNIMISKSRKLKGNSSSRLETKLSPKSILPHLHVKTHFKAATTFTLAYPGSFYCPATTSIGQAIENMKTDKEKLSVRNLFNTFKNIECKF